MKTKFQLGDYILEGKAQIKMIDKIEISIESKGLSVTYYGLEGRYLGTDDTLNKDYVRRMEIYLTQLQGVLTKMKNRLGIEE